jgi:hypothetical protein
MESMGISIARPRTDPALSGHDERQPRLGKLGRPQLTHTATPRQPRGDPLERVSRRYLSLSSPPGEVRYTGDLRARGRGASRPMCGLEHGEPDPIERLEGQDELKPLV